MYCQVESAEQRTDAGPAGIDAGLQHARAYRRHHHGEGQQKLKAVHLSSNTLNPQWITERRGEGRCGYQQP